MLFIGDNFDASLNTAWEQEEEVVMFVQKPLSEEEQDDLFQQVIQEYYEGIDLDDCPF